MRRHKHLALEERENIICLRLQGKLIYATARAKHEQTPERIPKKSREESLEEINGKEADRMLDKLNRQTRKLLEYLLSFQVHHPMSSRLV